MITIINLTKNAIDLEGGLKIAGGGKVSRQFTDRFVAILRNSPLIEVIEDGEESLLERAEKLGIKVDGRWSDRRIADEIEKVEKCQ